MCFNYYLEYLISWLQALQRCRASGLHSRYEHTRTVPTAQPKTHRSLFLETYEPRLTPVQKQIILEYSHLFELLLRLRKMAKCYLPIILKTDNNFVLLTKTLTNS